MHQASYRPTRKSHLAYFQQASSFHHAHDVCQDFAYDVLCNWLLSLHDLHNELNLAVLVDARRDRLEQARLQDQQSKDMWAIAAHPDQACDPSPVV